MKVKQIEVIDLRHPLKQRWEISFQERVRNLINSNSEKQVNDLRLCDSVREQMLEIQKSVWFLQDIL